MSRARNGQHARQTPRNVQARLRTAVKAANEALAEVGIEPIGAVSPHSLRRTYASLRYALGDDPIYVAEQGGWSDMRFPMRVYARAIRRRDRLADEHLAAFDRARAWAQLAGNRQGAAFEPVPGQSGNGRGMAGTPGAKLESGTARL